MNWVGKLIGGGFEGIANGIDEVVTSFTGDKAEQQKMAAELKKLVYKQKHETEQAAAGVVKAEAKSEHFLTASWRPITMLTFVGLIVAHWLGFTPENLPNSQVMALLDIVKIGLGGYVIGRSGEKGIKAWKEKNE